MEEPKVMLVMPNDVVAVANTVEACMREAYRLHVEGVIVVDDINLVATMVFDGVKSIWEVRNSIPKVMAMPQMPPPTSGKPKDNIFSIAVDNRWIGVDTELDNEGENDESTE